MNTVIRHIEYLVAHKECVIIPGIGAILATFENARIDKTKSVLLPPQRVYTFNKDISHNDGTLACSIARAESIRYELACRKMESEVEAMHHVLHTKGELDIGRIGTLHYDRNEGTIQFQPSAGSQSVCANVWLPAIKLGSKISYVTNDRQAPSPRIKKSPIKNYQGTILKRLSRAVAAIAFVAGICFLATLLPAGHNDEAMKASLAPEFSSSAFEDNIEVATESLSIIASDKYKDYSEIDDEAAISIESVQANTKKASSEPHKRHYIVVATVHTNEEADRFIAQHSGDELNKMPYKNLYIVYNSTSSDKAEAYTLCCEAVKKYPGAWIYTK